jgi:hypothetical protein
LTEAAVHTEKELLGEIENIFLQKKSTIIFYKSGIVEIKIKDGSLIEMEDSMEQFELLKSTMPPEKHLVLTDAGQGSSITKEVREFGNSPEAAAISKAQAVIVYSLYQRILVNFLINIARRLKHGMTVKLFTDRMKAIEWLMNMKER